MSNVELRVNEFKQVSRNLFKNFCTQYALIEVDIPKGEFSNPYKIRFENDRIFYIIESISYGSRASISFGKLGADYKYGIHNALCELSLVNQQINSMIIFRVADMKKALNMP